MGGGGLKLPKDKVRSHREHSFGNSSRIAKPRATREPNEEAFLKPEKKNFIIPVQQNLITAIDHDFYGFLGSLFSDWESL